MEGVGGAGEGTDEGVWQVYSHARGAVWTACCMLPASSLLPSRFGWTPSLLKKFGRFQNRLKLSESLHLQSGCLECTSHR